MANRERQWEFVKAGIDEEVLFVRLRKGMDPLIRSTKYTHELQIAVHYQFRHAGRLPDESEMNQLDEIEDRFCALLESDGSSVLAIVSTSPTMREFVFYTSEPQIAKSRIKELKQLAATHELSTTVQPDSEWRMYQRLLSHNN